MKIITKTIIALILFTFSVSVYSQVEDAIEVETSLKKISKDQYDVIFEFFIEEGWHLYSQYNPKGASKPLEIKPTDDSQTDFEIVGKAIESKTHKKFNEMFEKEEIFFEEEATIKQRIRLKNEKLKKIKITISGQICQEYCLPYEQDFVIKVKTKKKKQKKTKFNVTKLVPAKIVEKLPFIAAGLAVLIAMIIIIVIIKKPKK